tara:strand:+ start:1155 stop:1580 length:426 start_codon:yes stop_codon:yes gene_type:complete
MDVRKLHHNKAKQVKVSSTAPINSDGQNGDMQLVVDSNLENNELLYIKINNEWKVIGLEDRPNFNSGRIISNIETLRLKKNQKPVEISVKDSTGLTLDGATLSIDIEGTTEATALDAVGTLSHRITVWINGVEYYLYLDPV